MIGIQPEPSGIVAALSTIAPSGVVAGLAAAAVVAAVPRPTSARAFPVPASTVSPSAVRRGPRLAGATGGLAAVAVLAGWFAAVVVAAGIVAVRRARRVMAARSRLRHVERELPDLVDLFVVVVRSGLTPRQAIEEVAHHTTLTMRDGCRAVIHAMQRGEPLADAIDALVVELGSPAAPLADAVRSTERAGLPLSSALDALSIDNRLTRRRLDEAAARRLPITLSFPLVVCTLPSFVLLAVAPMVMAAISSLGSRPW